MENIPRNIAFVIGAKMATLKELQTFYSVKDMWDMLEVVSVQNINQKIAIDQNK